VDPQNTRITPSSRVILTEMPDGKGVLLDMDTKFYYELNVTGVFVWKQFGGRSKLAAELVSGLVSEFEVETETAAEDVAELISELAGNKLVVVASV
jgi:hypothetical protein